MGCHRKNIARVEIRFANFTCKKKGTETPLQHRGFSIPICGNGKDLFHSLIANYFLSADKHRIPKTKEPIFFLHCHFICMHDFFFSGQCGHQHQQCRLRQMEICDQGIDTLELIARIDKDLGPAAGCFYDTIFSRS